MVLHLLHVRYTIWLDPLRWPGSPPNSVPSAYSEAWGADKPGGWNPNIMYQHLNVSALVWLWVLFGPLEVIKPVFSTEKWPSEDCCRGVLFETVRSVLTKCSITTKKKLNLAVDNGEKKKCPLFSRGLFGSWEQGWDQSSFMSLSVYRRKQIKDVSHFRGCKSAPGDGSGFSDTSNPPRAASTYRLPIHVPCKWTLQTSSIIKCPQE